MIYVLIPSCNPVLATSVLGGLARHATHADWRTVVVLNDPESHDFQLPKNQAEVIRIPERIGYVRAVNMAYKVVRPWLDNSDRILCLNDDVEVRGSWQGDILHSEGQAGPSVKYIGKDGRWGGPENKHRFVEGWCWCAPVCAIEQAAAHPRCGTPISPANIYDEQFHPGFCEDMDLSLRIKNAGFRIVQLEMPFSHMRSQTFGGDREPFWTRNRRYLVDKWGLDK